MRVIRYGFFGEDVAQREFLASYLGCLETPDGDTLFDAVSYFGKRFGPLNNKAVDRLCADACREAFVLGHPLLDCLFIGRDVDTFNFDRHEQKAEEFHRKIPVQWHGRTLLMLPMQCDEHWLLYLAQHPDRQPLERKPNDQAKTLVYADTTKSKAIIRTELLATLSTERIAWLTTVSVSFLAFHKHVEAFLSVLPPEVAN